MRYTSNRLVWQLDDERKLRTPQGTVWSCQVAGESFEFAFNRPAAAHAKSQDHRASCGVFAFGGDCLMMVNAQADAMGEYPEPPRKAQWFMSEISADRHHQTITDRQGALANGLHGLNPRNTGNRSHPLVCRPALIERLVKDWVQRWNKARSISESIPHGHLGFCVFKEH